MVGSIIYQHEFYWVAEEIDVMPETIADTKHTKLQNQQTSSIWDYGK